MATFNDLIESWTSNIFSSLNLPNPVTMLFDSLREFYNDLMIMGMYAWIVVLFILYVAILSLFVYIPLKIYPFFRDNKKLINKIIFLK